MNIVITQFTDCEALKARVTKRFKNTPAPELLSLLAFIDSARQSIERTQGATASIYLQRKFNVNGTRVKITAKTVHGMFPQVLARFFS